MYEVNSIGIEIAKLILKNKKIVKEYVRNTLLSKKKLLNFLKQKMLITKIQEQILY